METLYYGYSDYQGNLLALTNESGTVVERYAYDPWGKRRNPSDWTQIDTRTSWIVSRGYTMHEHLDAFGIINMNGRVYDPLTAMFFSPDPFVQAPGNWLNFNRYAYCYGNPFKYTDPDGEWVWLVFAVYGAWQMGIQAGVAAENNGGNFWKDGFWKGALVGFATGALGSIAPLGTEWVGSMAWGAILGTASQAGTVWAMGGNDYSKIWQGALIGGAMGFVSSQQFGNWFGGKGFVNNNQVLKNFSAGKYDVSGFNSWQDAALDYFGFEGKYYSNSYENDAWFSSKNGIGYSDGAFSSYDNLKQSYTKEMFEKTAYLNNSRVLPENPTGDFRIDRWQQEFEGHKYLYKNNGLYPKATPNPINPLNETIKQMKSNNLLYGEQIFNIPSFRKEWWHIIYRIQRRF